MEILLNFSYPGNARELENILEHALIISQENEISPEHLPDYVRHPIRVSKPQKSPAFEYSEEVVRKQRQQILEALSKYGGNRNQTAKALGIDRTTLWRKMKRYDLL